MELNTTELCELWRAISTQKTVLIAEREQQQRNGMADNQPLEDRLDRLTQLQQRIDAWWKSAEAAGPDGFDLSLVNAKETRPGHWQGLYADDAGTWHKVCNGNGNPIDYMTRRSALDGAVHIRSTQEL